MFRLRPQRYIILLLISSLFSAFLCAQSFNTEFGKNRVQYHDDFKYWNVYETENFLTYFYGRARNVAIPTVQMAELYHSEIQSILEHRTNQKIQIIVYKDLHDLKQSNVGLSDSFISKTGQTKIVGNRMFVYFDGNHQHLRKQIKEGIASVYLNSMLFGSTLQEIVQNAVLLDLPIWFKDGIVSYSSSAWNHLLDDELRDILYQDPERYADFENLAEDFPRIAGHSMWYYIDLNYGRSSISNLLYLTRITRNMENSFLYVLGTSYENVLSEWSQYYITYFQREAGKMEETVLDNELDLSNKDYVPPSILRMKPDGSKLAYSYNDIGKYIVKVRDLSNGNEEKVFKFGYRNSLQATDYNYPLLAWHPRRPELNIIYEKRDKIYLRKINFGKDETDEQVIPEKVNRIYSFEVIGDEDYIFSANTDGFSDLYTYNARTRNLKAISEDFYDDLDVRLGKWKGDKGVFFASNRGDAPIEKMKIDTILPIDNYDLYFLSLEEKDAVPYRITNTPNRSERNPIQIGAGKLTFNDYSSGINNIYIAQIENGESKPVSNLDRNTILHETCLSCDQDLVMYYYDGAYRTFAMDLGEEKTPYQSPYSMIKKEVEDDTPTPIILEEEVVEEKKEELKSSYLFQTEFADPPVLEPIDDTQDFATPNPFVNLLPSQELREEPKQEIHDFNSARIVASRVRFRLDNFTTKLDNEVLFEGLESAIGDQNELNYNPTGILVKGNIRDIFEDHELEIGARFPTTFDGSEYFLVYDYNKSLIDKRFALYRRSFLEAFDDRTIPSTRTRKNTWLGLFRLKYPINVYNSLRATTSYRVDRFYTQIIDQNSFEAPINTEDRIGLKLEYIHDSSLDIDINIKHGTRYKFYVEAINRFNIQVVDGFDFDLSRGFTTILGFDARHYIPLFKHSVIALRATGATSFGSERMLYYLGGANNWMFASFDESIPQPTDQSFAFRTAVPHLRGFDFNIRNGSTYGLVNIETRIPFVKYLSKRSIKNSFFRNLQLTFFFDAGMAWHGASPYSSANPLNTVQISRPPTVFLDVEYFRDPLVMGFGTGVRTSLLGYFLKFDYGWGIETREIQDPQLYFSIGTDF